MNDIDVLLHTIEAPDADPAADVRRGEQALRRRHRWQVGAAAVGVAAVGIVGFVAQGVSGAPGTSGSFAGLPHTASPRVRPAPHGCRGRCAAQAHSRLTAKQAQRRALHMMAAASTQLMLQTYRDVLAEHLDPRGTELRLAENQQGGGGTFGTKLDWRNGGMIEITVGRTWESASSFANLDGAGLTPTTFRGQPARVSTTGDDLVVSVRHDDGTIVSLVASTAFGNNGTSTASLGLTQRRLLEAAADPRLQLPPGV